ncbi:MAG: dTDP-4-dehydrorhamnose reductase [Candidatus Tectomicrobia bacterium]|uniref:dTDP-4-dehydrorhamnose reductase n=1 Tax=Tectimicrobiota bacterium TaxID=2528274 RepID=A0A938B3Z6_UNCTE|nr:dTDP-4-dehydrorhamnose reductase [Candidatus Tectomicrobia bacterium]
MKILVIGHRAMLAHELIPCLQQGHYEVVGCGRPAFDITQPASIQALLAGVRPDIVINTAAYTAVDRVESEPAAAFAVNRDGVALLAKACHTMHVPLVHLSTDYVFDGAQRRPYREDDPTAPLSIYGQSKWAGEEAIRTFQPQHMIVRTAWLYGAQGHNFVKTMLRLAHEQQVVRVVDDQYGCPTWTRALARALTVLCHALRDDRHLSPWGTYHYCGAGHTSWYGFACAIFEAMRVAYPQRHYHLEAIPTVAYPTPAQRPAYTVLDCQKFEATFGFAPRPWHESLRACLQEFSW